MKSELLDQLNSNLNKSDYTKVAFDDEMLSTGGLHMRQLSARGFGTR